jgi:hypothetical protein
LVWPLQLLSSSQVKVVVVTTAPDGPGLTWYVSRALRGDYSAAAKY